MIRYALACDTGHEFEGWFGSSDDFDHQRVRGLLECPICGSGEVNKQIMAPAIPGSTRRDIDPAGASNKHAVMMEMMSRVRSHVKENFDYVGDTFAREARAIHEGRSEERGIYGEATKAEVKSLVEDGVPVAPLPPEPPKKAEIN